MERSLRFVVPVLVALTTVVACSSDSDSPRTPGTTGPGVQADATTTTYGGPTAGTVTVSTSTITGQNGKMLLITLTANDAASGGSGQQVGVACVAIDSDSFSMPPTMINEVPAGGNPCAGGGAVAVLPGGAYTLTAGVYVGGSQQPDAQMSLEFEFAGGAFSAELMGADLSA